MGPRLTLYVPSEAPELALQLQRRRSAELGFEPTLSEVYREALVRGLRDMLQEERSVDDPQQVDIEDVIGGATMPTRSGRPSRSSE